MNKELDRMDKLKEIQYGYLKIVKPRIIDWSAKQNVKIYAIYVIPRFGESLAILIFYKTDAELKSHIQSGMTEKTKREIMRLLDEIGYINEINNNVIFEFDSHDNVKRNFGGNYFFRLKG